MRYLFVTLGIVVTVGLLAGLKVSQIKTLIGFGEAAAAAGAPPEVVGAMLAREDSWENRLYSVGTVAPARGVTVSSETPGVVRSIKFDSGRQVKAGQVLIELDTRVEAAELRSAKERERLARLTHERSTALFAGQAVSKAQLDTDESAWRSAAANAAALSAQIERKIVRAPFAGKVGIRMVNVGQFLAPGTPITELQSSEGHYVDFALPQHEIERLTRGTVVRINETSSGPKVEGVVSAIDPTLDPVARSGRVRATIPRSADGVGLSPGMFVNVSVVLPEKRKVTIVGVTALVHAAFGDSVFVVEQQPAKPGAPPGSPALVVRQQFVKAGETRGDFVEILEGVSPGQQVVSVGAFKLRNGASVALNDSVKLEPELAPRPANR